MSKIDIPAPEPTLDADAEAKKAPRSRGRYIDFVPRRKHSGEKPEAPTIIITPVVKVEETPAPEEVVEEAPDEVVIEHTTVAAAPEEVAEEAPEEVLEEPLEEGDPLAEFNNFGGDSETEEELARALDDFAVDPPTIESQEDFISEEDPDDYVETVLSQVSETRTETTVRRSPFLKNYNIEKRPLSSRAPVRETLPSADALPPTPREEYKEEEFVRRADSVPENAEVPVATPEEKTGSRLGMVLTVLITILLGAGVGVFVYLAFFQ
ncbi:hypothetical protein IJ103_00770 [Candidatus Saccharibacteria bacterium]|nr:hypothetical protein [Candidatus Saccharibacteria bacterium]